MPQAIGASSPARAGTRGAQLLYSFGSFGFNVLSQTMTLWLVYYLAPPPDVGRATLVPPALLGLVLGIGRVLDAVDDPLIGHWSDVTRSRWGRRLPFIIGGLPFLVLTFILLWTVPDAGLPWAAVYVFVVVQAYSVASTIVQQPYESVLAEMTRDPAQRVRISSWKVVFGVVGAALGLIGSGIVIGAFGFPGMAMVFGPLAAASILISAIGVRRLSLQTPPAQTLRIRDALRLTATNGQFLVLTISLVLFYVGLNMLTMVIPYFVTVVLRQPDSQVTFFTALFFVMAVASLPVVNWLVVKWGKAAAYRLAMALLAVLLPGLYFAGRVPGMDPFLQALLYVGLLGAPMSVIFALPNPLVADVVDADALRTGQRREGAYYGVKETVVKAGTALSAAIFGMLIATFGFSVEQPLGVLLVGPIAGASVALGFVLFSAGYRLPDRVVAPAAERERV